MRVTIAKGNQMGMIRYLMRVFRSKPLTIAYPLQVLSPERGIRGTPVLDLHRCDLTGACQDSCPTRAIRIDDELKDGRTWQIDYGLCVFCGACVQACPRDAIQASPEFELAVRHRPETVRTFSPEEVSVRI